MAFTIRVNGAEHSVDVDGDIRSEHEPLGTICCNCVDGGKRVRRDHRPPPANYISVVIVVRWLDQQQRKTFRRLVRGLHVNWVYG